MQAQNLHYWRQLAILGLSAAFLVSGPALSIPVEVKGPAQPKDTESKATDTKAAAKTYSNTILGDWTSEWGPVKFNKEGGTINGSWVEGKNKIGKIDHGVFDEKTGSFKYNFVETWTGLKGKADMKLSPDHGQLSGTWVRDKTKAGPNTGTWSMKRN